MIAAVFYTLATHAFLVHRTALALWTAVALVFAVFGVDKGIYGDLGGNTASAAEALGAGYLLLAFVNVCTPIDARVRTCSHASGHAQIFWLAMFSSDPSTAFVQWVSSLSRGQPLVSGRSVRSVVGHRRGSSGQNMHEASNGQAYPSSSAAFTGADDSFKYNAGMENGYAGGPPVGPGVRASAGSVTSSQQSAPVQQHAHMPGSVGLNRPLNSAPSLSGDSQRLQAQEKPLMSTEASQPPTATRPQAKALYSYAANAEDPNEISFTKGDVLDVIDSSGKWWQ